MLYMACGGMTSKKMSKVSFFFISFYCIFFHVIFCPIGFIRQWEQSGLHLDTSSLVTNFRTRAILDQLRGSRYIQRFASLVWISCQSTASSDWLFRSNINSITCFRSDFRNENNGLIVLGWVFFSSNKFRLFN